MTWPLIGIFLLVAVAALKIGSTFVLPIVVSVLFTFLLGPPVRWLKKRRLPEAIGAGVLVFGTVMVLCSALYFLAEPASEWIWGCAAARVDIWAGLGRAEWPGGYIDLLCREGRDVRGFELSDVWLDIGTKDALERLAWLAQARRL